MSICETECKRHRVIYKMLRLSSAERQLAKL